MRRIGSRTRQKSNSYKERANFWKSLKFRRNQRKSNGLAASLLAKWPFACYEFRKLKNNHSRLTTVSTFPGPLRNSVEGKSPGFRSFLWIEKISNLKIDNYMHYSCLRDQQEHSNPTVRHHIHDSSKTYSLGMVILDWKDFHEK